MSPHTSTFLVEHYWPGVTEEKFREASERVRAVADAMASEGVDIRFLHSTLVLEDQAAFCVFEAASRQLVEDAYGRADVQFERVVNALEMELTAVNGPPRPRRGEEEE